MMQVGKGLDVRLLVTDLDNTLYDWEAFFVPALSALLDETERISGIPREDLELSFRRVYQKHRTSEYAFVLEEADVLRAHHPGAAPSEIAARYRPAIEAFRDERNRHLRLYPGVRGTLQKLRAAGITLVAQSDSPMGYVSLRLRQLDIDHVFSAVSAPEDHGVPSEFEAKRVEAGRIALLPMRTIPLPFDAALRKPDPRVLDSVFQTFGVSHQNTAYIGDNISRDVLVARRAGVVDIWARYGARHDPALRQQLLRTTYWTDADVASEVRLRGEADLVPPTYVVDSFPEVLGVLGITQIAQ